VRLDHFKTQVLLLHSEQSALDSLSAGFGERYTVHCATSGSEALNTLGETPINVIISAQDLPGMSGAEALREAKKRSPETVGILLTGGSGRSSQALVGDEEVFQVVAGEMTGESLQNLVDNATRQMRLMALAESANDMAASPDEPAEHIVMETSENGSTIISDGTGRFRALDQSKMSAASAVGARAVDVLVLTKDQEFLTTIRESSRGMHAVHLANTLKQADDAVRNHKVGVVVIDAAMVGQKVEPLTLHLRKGCPRLVAIVAGRRDDGEMLMELINRGKVYRFLLKPVSPGRARLAVEASIKHHLEAPDAAFKAGGVAGAAPPPKPAAKARPRAASRPVAKPAPASAPKAAPQPAARKKPAPAASAQPAAGNTPRASATAPPRQDPPLRGADIPSPIEDGLSAAFGGDDKSFTETMTGLIGVVGKKLGGNKPKAEARSLPEPRVSDTLADFVTLDDSGGSRFGKPLLIGIGAAALVAVAGTLYWFMGDGTDVIAPPIDEPEVVSLPAQSESEPVVDTARPRATGLPTTVGGALEQAEVALLDSNLDEARAAIQRLAELDPDNDRLPFMRAQLKQIQLSTYLAGARNAIRESRYQDATNLVAEARALDIDAGAEIDAVARELGNARTGQRADEVLSLAATRLDEGKLIAPVNDNARYYYDLVLSKEPDNAAAQQGLTVVANMLVLEARAETADGNFDAAADLLRSARAIVPSSTELAAANVALQSARDAAAGQDRQTDATRRQGEAEPVAAEEQQAEADRNAQAEADRVAAEQQAEADRIAQAEADRIAAEQQAEADRIAQAEADRIAAEQQAEAERIAAEPAAAEEAAGEDAGGPEVSSPDVSPAGEAAMAAAALRPEPTPEQAAEANNEPPAADPSALEPVAVSELERTRYVAPKYPRAAERRGETGWVDVIFTVTFDGTVKDVEIRESEPEGVFERSATRAVERWEFEPIVENGTTVEKRAAVRMMFALE
jgi:TonB family protein